MKEIDLFKRPEHTMSVKEVAEILKVSRQLVSEKVKELFPEIVQNGIETRLNELQVTLIKLSIEKNPMLPSTVVEGMALTKLNKALVIKQAMDFQNEIIADQQKEIEELKPRALGYDNFMNGKNFMSVAQVAKIFGTGRNRLFNFLKEQRIFLTSYEPYQKFVDEGYFIVRVNSIPMGTEFNVKPQIYFTPKGFDYIAKKFKKYLEDLHG